MMKYGEITCKLCGVSWYGPKCGKLYCDKCRKKVDAEKSGAYAKRKATKNRAKENKKHLSLLEIVRLADAEGMTYAKYCMKHGI